MRTFNLTAGQGLCSSTAALELNEILSEVTEHPACAKSLNLQRRMAGRCKFNDLAPNFPLILIFGFENSCTERNLEGAAAYELPDA